MGLDSVCGVGWLVVSLSLSLSPPKRVASNKTKQNGCTGTVIGSSSPHV